MRVSFFTVPTEQVSDKLSCRWSTWVFRREDGTTRFKQPKKESIEMSTSVLLEGLKSCRVLLCRHKSLPSEGKTVRKIVTPLERVFRLGTERVM